MAQTEFDLEPSQSMLMTGKGPGQDATINPFAGEDCFAIVENLGMQAFSVRIQKKGALLDTLAVGPKERKTFKLLKDQELYLDAYPTGGAKARVGYAKIPE